MRVKDYYQLLDVQPSATADEIKHAFRHQIARYHPDKVQHLGAEFQAMAAERAAELTEAYRILSAPVARAEYDRAYTPGSATQPAAPPAPAGPPAPAEPEVPPPAEPWGEGAPRAAPSEERTRGEEFIRRAALARFQTALDAAVGGGFDQSAVRGFDVALVPKPKLFGRARGPRLLAKFVPAIDAASVAAAWVAALKWRTSPADEICVLLMSPRVASRRELADAIDEQRRKSRGASVTLVPIDARDWQAHVPHDVPAVVRAVLDRLRNPAG